MENIKPQNNFHVSVLPTTKFKTTMITLKFMAPLDDKTITSRSLLSKMLMRATKKYPTDKDLNRRLSELYGAYVNSYVSKFKDKHVITISLEIVNEKYLKDSSPLFEQGIELLKEIIWNPLITNGLFDETLLTQEKSLLTKKLEAVEDNKSQLAFLNLLQHMFGDQSYSQLSTGKVENITHITNQSLFNTYQSMIENDYCAVYVVGNVDESEVTANINKHFKLKPFKFESFNDIQVIPKSDLPKVVVEYDDIDQTKLNMGFKFPCRFGDKDYFTFVVFNMMFGGDPSSVLFNEVREKQSLAYSIHSQIDSKNGYMFVLSGVSSEKYDKAQTTIINEFENFQQGNFTDDKIDLAKKVIISQRQEAEDRPKSIIERLNNNLLLDADMTESEYIEGIMNVSRDQIVTLAQATVLDTIYILTKGGEA